MNVRERHSSSARHLSLRRRLKPFDTKINFKDFFKYKSSQLEFKNLTMNNVCILYYLGFNETYSAIDDIFEIYYF